MLLGRPAQTGAIGKRTLRQRASTFAEGHWHQLLDGVRGPEPGRRRAPSSAEACAERAAAQVRRGELSRARQTLTSSPLAPGTDETLAILQDPTRRPPALQTALPTNLQEYQPQTIRLNPQEVAEALRTAKRGSAPGLSGATAEHYKVLLDDEEGLSLFSHSRIACARAGAGSRHGNLVYGTSHSTVQTQRRSQGYRYRGSPTTNRL